MRSRSTWAMQRLRAASWPAGHRLGAAEDHHIVPHELIEVQRVEHRRLPAPEIIAVGQPATLGELRIAVPQLPILQQIGLHLGAGARIAVAATPRPMAWEDR